MGYTVKSIKTINGVDGQGFSAKIYFDGKLIGQVFDYADGAPVVLDMQAVHRKSLMDYVDTLIVDTVTRRFLLILSNMAASVVDRPDPTFPDTTTKPLCKPEIFSRILGAWMLFKVGACKCTFIKIPPC